MSRHSSSFSLFLPPYESVVPIRPDAAPRDLPLGSALVWRIGTRNSPAQVEFARRRPPGLALIAVLPPAGDLDEGTGLVSIVERCRPQSLLPFHPDAVSEDLAAALRRPPEVFAVEVTDYLAWRGVRMDGDTRRLLRRTLDLSGELRTVSGLARAVYLSRRALGRRFLSRGLPVPSHWLHFGRILRGALRLQNSDDSLFAVAAELGYPDGFALSNQMHRLLGIRPSLARERLGWEWLAERWLETEREVGGLTHTLWESTWAGRQPDPEAHRPSSGPRWRSGAPVGAGR